MTGPLIAARDAFVAARPEARVSVNRREWGVIRAGDAGPALLLIPGTLGRADIFWQQIGALAGKARIMALTYPSSGGIADWAGDVAALVRAEGMEGAVILGSSLGGYLAQYAAAAEPRLFSALVAANTLPSVAGIERLPPYAYDLDRVDIDELRAGFTKGLQGWLAPGNAYADLAGLLLAEVEGRIPEGELRARLKALKHAPPLPAQGLPRTRIFTVESGDDHLIGAEIRAALREALRPSRAYVFETASHFPYVTRPHAYCDMLCEILGLAAPDSPWPAGAEARL